jgi:hypothetical protein
MTIKRARIALLAGVCFLSIQAIAAEKGGDSPEAGGRTYAQNYKDMALALCISTAYGGDAAVDAGSSFSALRDWTLYDMENAPEKMKQIVEKYLRRDYHNPLVEAETKADIKFNFLKCLDMYHSKELDAQVKRVVSKPNRTYRQDYPAK